MAIELAHDANRRIVRSSNPTLTPAVLAGQIQTARELFREYAAELQVDLCFQSFEEELASLPGKYAPPAGGLWLATCDTQACGCVALRRVDAETCEMKRLFVRPTCRRAGVGRKLVIELLDVARRMSYRRMVLDTLERLRPAIALYQSLGFETIAPYCPNPIPDAVFLQLAL